MTKKLLTTLSSRQVYNNPWITVYEDVTLRPSGEKGIYGYVRARPTVGIVAIDRKGKMYLCKQYRYIFKDYSWEIPRGYVNDEETRLGAAKRELSEEAGLTAASVKRIGSLRLSIGILDEECHVYLAEESYIKQDPDKEEIQKIYPYSIAMVKDMIEKGTIKDGLTVGAFTLALQKLQKYL